MGELIQEIFNFLSVETAVILIAALPIIELRGAIPIGVSFGLSPLHSTILSFIGSIAVVPILLFGIRPAFDLLKKTKLFRKTIERLTDRSLSKSDKIQKYGAWGLVLFVAIPLPGTGVWTGTLIAALLNIRFKWAFPAILFGNLIAAILIMTLSHGVVNVLS
ncbi:small multi-drug export protein [Irregularibacter muris]|uniref:Small multi-drug export protein n=1 Tax=Irregularibacter muris TaxID=1796619 RepID=A0AAE3HH64_9FIRM|nr:small multi-drug export protein [Irregularibacter muris]MCR1900071.1 small multi-drug export protein [Irregularibacter muris]